MASKKSAPRFATQNRVVLPGSEKAPLAAASGEKPSPASTRITVSVIVRRKKPLKAANRLGKERLTRAQYRQTHAADPDAVKLVRAFAKEYGLTVAAGHAQAPNAAPSSSPAPSPPCRRPSASPSSRRPIEGATYRVREGSITLPAELVGPVEAVLGLDNRPQAKPHFRVFGEAGAAQAPKQRLRPAARRANVSYTPVQVGAALSVSLQAPPPQARPSASSSSAAATAPPTSPPTSKPSARPRPPSPPSPSTAARTPPPTPTAPTAKSCSTSKSPPPSHPAPRSSSTSPPTPTRASSTPSPPPSTTPPTTPASSPSVGAAPSPAGPRRP